ncbi:phosphoglucosamine mutase [Halarsenatibacter silvermanii]|uniref:Phosphoglucosamine mutase n=1 Tax=Halarsenatibacter silvermanii TaxID=321763 RepID=A0A1G9NF52_9FIRM|nr:phosphoglucosamine mutase [Halarsenatibacter silvermanii]SDL84565.1 phosphoglucosamine mutase [Halarsenatibacter silvermanii]
MGSYFGTDGVRGVANEDLTPELALKLGKAGGDLLLKKAAPEISREEARVIVGKDTRISGDMLFGALMAGLAAVGIDVVNAGVVPTPAVAFMTSRSRALGGIMISASHNPVADNGIKFFDAEGFKLSDEEEDEIETLLEEELDRAAPDQVGRRFEADEALIDDYLESLKEAAGIDLSELNAVLDCAQGAAHNLGPRVLKELGVGCKVLNDEGRGDLINVKSGSTDPDRVKKSVVNSKADLGIALDGDADRCLLIDENGKEVDGDRILSICALDMIENGGLNKNRLVTTKYSNLGLRELLSRKGASVEFAASGDKYVLEKMKREDLNLGGEKSGHIIFLDHNTTGDGLLTALKVMSVMVRQNISLSDLSSRFSPWPQKLINIRVSRKNEWSDNEEINREISRAEEDLSDGRVFVRASGTEPLVRVMLESRDEEKIKKWQERLEAVISRELN